jgi:hypothetical protein
MATLKGCQRKEYQINCGMDTRGEKKKRTSKKNVDGWMNGWTEYK